MNGIKFLQPNKKGSIKKLQITPSLTVKDNVFTHDQEKTRPLDLKFHCLYLTLSRAVRQEEEKEKDIHKRKG